MHDIKFQNLTEYQDIPDSVNLKYLTSHGIKE